MRQEIRDGTAGKIEGRVRRVGIGKAARSKNVEADQDFDMRHLAELAAIDQLEDALRRLIEHVIVVFDEMPAALPRLLLELLEFVEG